MAIELLHSDGESARISLSGRITISEVAALWPALYVILQNHKSVQADLSGVTDMDTAGFQVLLMARKFLGKGLQLSGHSHAVLRIFDLYGAVSIFGDKIRISPEARANYRFQYGIRKRIGSAWT